MRNMKTLVCTIVCAASLNGCLSVRTPNVHVEVLHPSSLKDHDQPSRPRTTYADALDRVVEQQHTVLKELEKRDWDELVDESYDWVQYVRTLSGLADTSHDPAEFSRQCDDLLRATEAVVRAARSRDAVRCQQAIDACDPVIDRFCRTFPRTPTGNPPPTPPPAEPSDDRPRVP